MSVHVQATKRTKLHVFEQCTLCENGLRSFAPSNMLTHHPDISLVRRFIISDHWGECCRLVVWSRNTRLGQYR